MPDIVYQILVIILGGANGVQFYSQWKNRNAASKSADAIAVTDEANSLKVTAEVFTLLTEITKNQVSEIRAQLGTQKEEINMLHKLISEYERRCSTCVNNKR
jgi:tyrosyl-tRNA synthetase